MEYPLNLTRGARLTRLQPLDPLTVRMVRGQIFPLGLFSILVDGEGEARIRFLGDRFEGYAIERASKRTTHEDVFEHPPVIRRELIERVTVEDARHASSTDLGQDSRQHANSITGNQPGRCLGGKCYGPTEPFDAFGLIRPHQCLDPESFVRVAHIHRAQVDADPGGNC